MTPDDVIDVLAKAAAFDQRTIGQADVLAWTEVLHSLELPDALEAVTRHYTESRERLMPADVIRHARAARDARRRRGEHAEVRALPSRFEPDEFRDIRVQAGIARCRDVLEPVLDMLADRRRKAS